MTLFAYGPSNLQDRFIELIRQQLGERLGPLIEREGPEIRLAGPVSGAGLSRDAPGRFLRFLERIIRDERNRVELELTSYDRTVHFGDWYGPRQVVDVRDIEAIRESSEALTRAGVITHEIAERWHMVSHGFEFAPAVRVVQGRAVRDDTLRLLDEATFYLPAHEYAIEQESRVTGWRRVGYHRRELLPQRARENPRVARAMRLAGTIPLQDEFVFEERPDGAGRRGDGWICHDRGSGHRRVTALLNAWPWMSVNEEVAEGAPASSRDARSHGMGR